MPKKNLLTTKEAAEVIGVSQRSIVNYILKGRMTAEKEGTMYFTTKAEARRIQRENAASAKAKEKAKKARAKGRK